MLCIGKWCVIYWCDYLLTVGDGVQQGPTPLGTGHQLGPDDDGSDSEPHVSGRHQSDDDVLLHSLCLERTFNSELVEAENSDHILPNNLCWNRGPGKMATYHC